MRRQRNVKILATLGPASDDPAVIAALFAAGADAFRLNFSHGTPDAHRARVTAIRALEKQTGRCIAILADLQGPKLRIGSFAAGSVELVNGQPFRLDLEATPGDATRVQLPHPEILRALARDAELLLDDGKIRLRVERHNHVQADCIVTVGGKLSNQKGVNLPGVIIPVGPLTEKDHRDLGTALDLGVDWIALSFVQRPEDVAEARKLIAGRAALLAKIEKPSAIEHLEEIIELSDAIMVARGDLGVEMPMQQVPGLQKRMVREARHAGKPVVVATQMLESMIQSPTPTRAEVSDVATAVYDGADCLMLSAESAAGKYPVGAVRAMNDVAVQVERDPLYRGIMDAEHASPDATLADAISAAARQVAETIGAVAIVTYTMSGSTAYRAARERPRSPILCLTPAVSTARRLALAWGIHAVESADAVDFADMVQKACNAAESQGFALRGDAIAITAGFPFGTPGATNVLRIARVP